MILKDEVKKFSYEIELFFESEKESEEFTQFAVEKGLKIKEFIDSTTIIFKTPNDKEVKIFQEWKDKNNF